jgi:hypothetical protein
MGAVLGTIRAKVQLTDYNARKTIFYCLFIILCCPVFNLGWKNILIEYFIIHTILKNMHNFGGKIDYAGRGVD